MTTTTLNLLWLFCVACNVAAFMYLQWLTWKQRREIALLKKQLHSWAPVMAFVAFLSRSESGSTDHLRSICAQLAKDSGIEVQIMPGGVGQVH